LIFCFASVFSEAHVDLATACAKSEIYRCNALGRRFARFRSDGDGKWIREFAPLWMAATSVGGI
jgi:hypothetical protein